MRLLCWLRLHKWAWNTFAGSGRVDGQFCTRKGCLASRFALTGKVYKRQPLFSQKS